ncbi:MAG: protein kinase [Myxococcota bacterium]
MRKLDADGLAESFVAILDDPAGKQVIARRILPVVARDPGRVAQLRARVGDLRISRHPSLVPVLDLVEADGDLYVLEEWSDAVDVGTVLQHCVASRATVPHNVFLNLATQVCNALEALHGRPGHESGSENVLHLALSPQAMSIALDGRVTVGRYGLARSPTALATAATGALPPGVEYLAPEQTHQDQKLTPASDIFALGAILYELLTLKPLFRADSSLQTVHRVRRAEVTTQLLEVKDIMPGLDKVLFRALSLNPRHRYQRAFVLREDLRGLMAGYSFNDIDAVTRAFLTPILRARSEGAQETSAPYFETGGDTTGFLLGHQLEPIGDPDSDYTDALLLEDSDAIGMPIEGRGPGREIEVERDTDRGDDLFDPEEADTAQNVHEELQASLDESSGDTDVRPHSNTAWVRQPGGGGKGSAPSPQAGKRSAIEPVDTGYSRRPTAQPLSTSWRPPEAFQGVDDAETTGAHENTTNLLEPTTGPIDDLLLDPPPAAHAPTRPAPRSGRDAETRPAPGSLTSSSSMTAPQEIRRDTLPIGRGGPDPMTLDIDPDSAEIGNSRGNVLPDTAEFARRGSPLPSAPPAPQTASNADRERQERARRNAAATWADSQHTQPSPVGGVSQTSSSFVMRPPPSKVEPSTQTLELQDEAPWSDVPTQTQSTAADFVAPPPVQNPVAFDDDVTGRGYAPSPPQAPMRSTPPPVRRPVDQQQHVADADSGGGSTFLTIATLLVGAGVLILVCAGLGVGAATAVSVAARTRAQGPVVAMTDPVVSPEEMAAVDPGRAAVDVATPQPSGAQPPVEPTPVTERAAAEPVPDRDPVPVAVRDPVPDPVPVRDPVPDRVREPVPVRDPVPVRSAPDPVPTRNVRSDSSVGTTTRPPPPPPPMPEFQQPAETFDAVADADLSAEASPALDGIDQWSDDAFAGHLSPAAKSTLSEVPAADPAYTRARTLLYLDAKVRGARAERDGHLMAMMALPENKYNPVLLVESAQVAIEKEDWLGALKDAQTAEQHWARLPSDLVFSRKAMIYEIQAVAQTGLFYSSNGDNKDRLYQAIRNWERYRAHAETKNRTDLISRADERLEHLHEIQRRLE